MTLPTVARTSPFDNNEDLLRIVVDSKIPVGYRAGYCRAAGIAVSDDFDFDEHARWLEGRREARMFWTFSNDVFSAMNAAWNSWRHKKAESRLNRYVKYAYRVAQDKAFDGQERERLILDLMTQFVLDGYSPHIGGKYLYFHDAFAGLIKQDQDNLLLRVKNRTAAFEMLEALAKERIQSAKDADGTAPGHGDQTLS